MPMNLVWPSEPKKTQLALLDALTRTEPDVAVVAHAIISSGSTAGPNDAIFARIDVARSGEQSCRAPARFRTCELVSEIMSVDDFVVRMQRAFGQGVLAIGTGELHSSGFQERWSPDRTASMQTWNVPWPALIASVNLHPTRFPHPAERLVTFDGELLYDNLDHLIGEVSGLQNFNGLVDMRRAAAHIVIWDYRARFLPLVTVGNERVLAAESSRPEKYVLSGRVESADGRKKVRIAADPARPGAMRLSLPVDDGSADVFIAELGSGDVIDEFAYRASRPSGVGAIGDSATKAGLPSRSNSSIGRWMRTGVLLGHGGQSTVELVVHEITLERGALKMPGGKHGLDEQGRERFKREMDAFRTIQHPFVLRVLDMGEEPEPYLVTALAALGSVENNRAAFHGDFWRCFQMMKSIALALEATHSFGIKAHRDVKPSNILLHALDHAVLADFGVAHFAEKEALTTSPPHPASFWFSPPEVDHLLPPTPAFDVFGLAAVVHWLCTGLELSVKPYKSLAPGEIDDALTLVAPRVPKAFRNIVRRGLSKESGERQQSAAEVLNELQQVANEAFEIVERDDRRCACGGAFLDLGELQLGPGTEINVWGNATPSVGRGLMSIVDRAEQCGNCGMLRLRKAPFRRG